jgi:hypothetical protein
MEQEPILLMTPRYVFHKPFKVHFLTSMNGRMDLIQTIKEDWSGNCTGPRPEGTGAGVYKWGLRVRHSFSLGIHTQKYMPSRHA